MMGSGNVSQESTVPLRIRRRHRSLKKTSWVQIRPLLDMWLPDIFPLKWGKPATWCYKRWTGKRLCEVSSTLWALVSHGKCHLQSHIKPKLRTTDLSWPTAAPLITVTFIKIPVVNSETELVPILRGLKRGVSSHRGGTPYSLGLPQWGKTLDPFPTPLAFLASQREVSCSEAPAKPKSIHWTLQDSCHTPPKSWELAILLRGSRESTKRSGV